MNVLSYLPLAKYVDEIDMSMGGIAIGTIFLILGILLFVLIALIVIMVIFEGIGLMKMHKKLGLKGGWMSFFPILNTFAFGKVAEQYVKENGKKSAKFSVILTVLSVSMLFLAFAEFILSILVGLILGIIDLPAAYIEMVASVVSAVSNTIYYPLSCASFVISYVALWRIYAIFNNENATLWLVLSIVFPFLQPFFLFAARNNEPACVELKDELTFEEIVEAEN